MVDVSQPAYVHLGQGYHIMNPLKKLGFEPQRAQRAPSFIFDSFASFAFSVV